MKKSEGIRVLASEFDSMLKRMCENYDLTAAEAVGTIVIQLTKIILNLHPNIQSHPRTEEDDDGFGTTD